MIRPLPLLSVALLQLAAATTPEPIGTHSRYLRSVLAPSAGQTCAVLDAPTLAHAAPFLKDLRLIATTPAGPREIPFVLTLSEAQQAESEPARILNLGSRGRAIAFDLQMPPRPYTEVDLDLAAHDFLATATVTGLSVPGARNATELGTFNLFDLTSQHLSRSTTLHLQESSFPFLHITLNTSAAGSAPFHPTPQILRAATVPPSREAQTLFTSAARISAADLRASGRDTVARVTLPERVPVERVSVTLGPGAPANFSRDLLITTHTSDSATPIDTVTGTIRRVDLTRPGHDRSSTPTSTPQTSLESPAPYQIKDQQLSIPAILGANLQGPATVDVAIHNGDDPPLPIASVQLEMRQRSVCFQNPTPSSDAWALTLFYGDDQLPAPEYDLARTYTPSARSTRAQLGPEQLNPSWTPRPDTRAYTERHPHLIWVALLLVVGSLALAALRSSKTRLHPHR